MNIKCYFIFLLLVISTISHSQNKYQVTKDGSGNFKSIKEINSAKLSSGDIVSFKSGEQFFDDILYCQKGVTYNTYGGSERAILGNRTSNAFKNTVIISEEKIVIDNLHIYGFANASTLIKFSVGGWKLDNCLLEGGINAHEANTVAIRSTSNGYVGMPKTIISNSEFLELGKGLYVNRPYNMEISYNKFHELWMYDGRRDAGGNAMSFFTNGLTDRWNANYTLHIHHNEIYNFEYTAIGVTVSGMLIEYNEIHHNLDERIFRGGVKHGSISKLFDNTGASIGGVGSIFRYNYVHDLVRRGQPNYTYAKQTKALIDSRTFVVLSRNNNTGYSIYKESNSDGTDWGGQPDASISGLGYGNVYIHNNIFENISNQVFARGYSKKEGDPKASVVPYNEKLGSYFINNTIVNCGYSYAALYNSLIYIDASAQSPTFIINNIFDNVNESIYATIKGQEKEKNGYYVDYNIYLKQSGQSKGTSIPKNVAVWQQYGENFSNSEGEKYSTEPGWFNESNNLFAPNIGTDGSYLPDVRLKSSGSAHNSGLDYIKIGDSYNGFGKDPTGRSYAYDILGNLRVSNDIGAFGVANGTSSVEQPNPSEKPKILEHPSNLSTELGKSASFEVTASCEDEIGYQWWKFPYINETESKITNSDKYSGATSNKLTIHNITNVDANISYICEVYNKKNSSELWVNSNSASIVVNSSNVESTSKGEGIKVILEGAFSNGSMKSVLHGSKTIPQSQPYSSFPWEFNDKNTLLDINDDVVDWILVELRSGLRTSSYSKSALLLQSGKVVNTDGSDFFFDNVNSGSYFLILRHRNHLDIMSSEKLEIKNNIKINYDFTISQSLVSGNNSLIQLGNGKLGMIAGDTDANGVVNNLDFGMVANNIPLKGYSQGDIDMNGMVNVLDYTYINKNIFRKSFVPK